MKRGETSGRIDDNAQVNILVQYPLKSDEFNLIQTIQKRFDSFQLDSVPVVDYYKTFGIVSTVDGSLSANDCYSQVQSAFTGLLLPKFV